MEYFIRGSEINNLRLFANQSRPFNKIKEITQKRLSAEDLSEVLQNHGCHSPSRLSDLRS